MIRQAREMTLFSDPIGSFSSAEGSVLLELLLYRREVAQGQVKLLVQRAERRGQEFLLLREAARRMRPKKLQEFFNQENVG